MSLPPWERNDKQNGLSLDKFINAKQHNPRVTRELKKKAYYQKANIVKTYRRTLKKEGMLDQSKLSQKRKFDNGYSKGDKRQRTAKPDRHFKAKKAAEATKEKLAQQESEEKRVEKNIQEKKKQRDLMRKKFSKTTSRGQPIMKHRIENLLTKIIKDA